MKYFLFLNHPKGQEVYKVNEEREKMARIHFKSVDTLETEVTIRGNIYKAIIDYTAFSNLANFDCFNCQDPCCADNPSIYEDLTRELILDNLKEYDNLTHNLEILLEIGKNPEEIIESIKNDDVMVPDENAEEEISLCTCSFKPNNNSTLCAIHSICLSKGMSAKEIVEYKPMVCNLWPIDIIAEDDLSVLYITMPDDFTTGFTIEDYYGIGCINKELCESAIFRRKNPEGFSKNDFKPVIVAYGDTIKYSLGEKCYEDIKNNLIAKSLVFNEEFDEREQQILKKIN